LLAYRQFFAFKLNVEFDVSAFAAAFPRVSTMFHSTKPHIATATHWMQITFKPHAETDDTRCGEMS
jgi:hypothetical protein